MSGYVLFIAMILLMLIGIPIAFSIALAGSLFLIVTHFKELILIPQRTILGMDSFVLLAIPMFTFAGYLMEHGGLSKRLIDWVAKMFAFLPGSTGTITIVTSTIFASLTGSGPATVAAVGSLMIPNMMKEGYPKRDACGLMAAGGALGPIVPPSIAMVVYGCTMNLSIPKMFLASVLPGLLLCFFFILTNTIYAIRKGIKSKFVRPTIKEFLIATWKALGVLMLPVIILGGIYGGIFTPTEAAAVSVVYALILGIVYKDLNLKDIMEALHRTLMTSGVIMLIVGVSGIFGWLLSATRLPTQIASFAIPYMTNVSVYMVILLIVLFFIGCLMDTLPSILILAPILIPIGTGMGLDPLHLGVTFCIALITGFITPPFGINLFTVSSIANIQFAEVVRGVAPYIIASVIAVIIIAFIPGIVMLLPSLVYK